MNKLQLHPLLGDCAVLQRGQPVPVRGTAAPGARITVSIAGQKAEGRADPSGRWAATLPPMQAEGAQELLVQSDRGETLRSRNVVFGEVWLCSGQSNMQWPVSQAQNSFEELQSADQPMIRLFHVPQITAEEEQAGIPAAWTLCTPESAAPFSAVAFFFARDLQPRIGVPVGLINASWGGTVAEAWMPRSAFLSDPGMENLFQQLSGESDPSKRAALEEQFKTAMEEWRRKACVQDPGNHGEKLRWHDPEFDDSSWRFMETPGFWEQRLKLDADGALWFRRKFTLPAEWEGHDLILRLGAIDDFDHTYVNGRQVGRTGPENPNAYCTPRVYPVAAGLCRAGENTVAVRIFDHTGFGGFAGGDRMGVFLKEAPSEGSVDLGGPWRYEIECVFPPAPLRDVPPYPAWPQGYVGPAQRPCRIFNAMIAPLTGFPLAGVLWYQGESNDVRPADYFRVFTALIRAWRERWNRELPFFFVQLANYGVLSTTVACADAWAVIRDAQRRALALPATGMASAVDIGDAADVHPKNKQEVGRRLARLARARVYGEAVEESGPLFRSANTDGSRLCIAFDHADGLRFRGEPRGFSLADAGGDWRRANARLENGRLILSQPQIPEPCAVRYAWEQNPPCSLENSAGLPASPFEWRREQSQP